MLKNKGIKTFINSLILKASFISYCDFHMDIQTLEPVRNNFQVQILQKESFFFQKQFFVTLHLLHTRHVPKGGGAGGARAPPDFCRSEGAAGIAAAAASCTPPSSCAPGYRTACASQLVQLFACCLRAVSPVYISVN